ncbi:MAG: hypothetical protein ACRCVX_01485 [Shewanella sp.]
MNRDIESGAKVVLDITRTIWSEGPCNPSGVEGVVTSHDGGGWVGVMWENGIHNKYRSNDDDLVLVEKKA